MSSPYHTPLLLSALFRGDVRTHERSVESAITHLMNKALPQRCQIRNLKEIVTGYAAKYPEVGAFVERVGSLVGLRACECASLPRHQHVLFILLKHFVIHEVRDIPPLGVHLQQRCDWGRFCSVVCATCGRIAEIVKENRARDVDVLDGVDSVVRSIARVQSRNTMSPCIATLLLNISAALPPSRRSTISGAAPLHDSRTMLTTRILENYGMSMAGAFAFRAACTAFMEQGHKNPLHANVRKLCESDAAVVHGVVSRVLEQQVLHTRCAEWRSSIRLCVCRICHDVKNTRAPFTTLRDVVYDSARARVCCVRKRDGACRTTALLEVPMDKRCVRVKSTVYGVCSTCESLTMTPLCDVHAGLECSKCPARTVRMEL